MHGRFQNVSFCMEPPIVRYARSARAYLAGDRRRVAAGAVLLVGLVWMLARSSGVAGGESRQEHLQDVQVRGPGAPCR